MTQLMRYRTLEEFGFGPNVMKKTKVCTNCGRMVRGKAGSCPDCKAKLSGETLYDRYKQQHTCCPDCDTVLSPGSRYCPECGKSLL